MKLLWSSTPMIAGGSGCADRVAHEVVTSPMLVDFLAHAATSLRELARIPRSRSEIGILRVKVDAEA